MRILDRAGLASAAGGFVLGYGLSVIVGAAHAVDDALDAGGLGLGLAVMAALLGSAFGAGAAGRWSGRWLPYAAAGLLVLGTFGSALAPTVWALAGWRFGTGLAIGVLAGVVWPRSGRPIGLLLGVLSALLVDFFLDAWFGVPAWRWMFGTLVVPALLASALVCWGQRAPRSQGV